MTWLTCLDSCVLCLVHRLLFTRFSTTWLTCLDACVALLGAQIALRQIVNDVIDLSHVLVRNGSVELRNLVPSGTLVMADAERVVQILNNLISNAGENRTDQIKSDQIMRHQIESDRIFLRIIVADADLFVQVLDKADGLYHRRATWSVMQIGRIRNYYQSAQVIYLMSYEGDLGPGAG